MQSIEQRQMRRVVDRIVLEGLAQPVTDFLADGAAVNAVDLNIRVVGQSRHWLSSSLGRKTTSTQTNAAAPKWVSFRYYRSCATGKI
jgi:hypothetical protein